MLRQIVPDMFQRFYQEVLYPAFGQPELASYFFVAEALLAAELKNGLFLGRKQGKGLLDEGFAFAGFELQLQVVGDLGDICPNLVYEPLLEGYLAEVVQGLVAGDDEDVVAYMGDLGQLIPAGPQPEEGFLEDVFRIDGRVCHMIGKGQNAPAMPGIELAESRFISFP